MPRATACTAITTLILVGSFLAPMTRLEFTSDDAIAYGAVCSEIAELNAAVQAIEIRGLRLPEATLVFSGVEAPPPSSRP